MHEGRRNGHACQCSVALEVVMSTQSSLVETTPVSSETIRIRCIVRGAAGYGQPCASRCSDYLKTIHSSV